MKYALWLISLNYNIFDSGGRSGVKKEVKKEEVAAKLKLYSAAVKVEDASTSGESLRR